MCEREFVKIKTYLIMQENKNNGRIEYNKGTIKFKIAIYTSAKKWKDILSIVTNI
ncbi:hypothetical protein RST01_13970 [Rummeliibacillus stabekisii]|nr:hypothetical protein RST01_13970 [Rummeliibacillus stabekisii]